jgi:hypothetical protein
LVSSTAPRTGIHLSLRSVVAMRFIDGPDGDIDGPDPDDLIEVDLDEIV